MAKKTSADHIVLIGAGVAAAILLGYLGISYTYFDDTPVGCMDGYNEAVRFGLQTSEGLPLSMIELQAQAGGEELGMMQNAQIVNVDNAPVARVLEVKLGRVDGSDPQSAVGVHFPWRPDGSQNARSGCLRYSVLLPEDFDFSMPGWLPGMFGGMTPQREELNNEQSFALRTRWGRDGDTLIIVQSNVADETGRLVVSRPGSVRLDRGRWVTLEQELVLNSTGARDGAVRVWVDGVKLVEKKDLKLREDELTGISGVAATVGLAGNTQDVPVNDTIRLQISPIDFGWR